MARDFEIYVDDSFIDNTSELMATGWWRQNLKR